MLGEPLDAADADRRRRRASAARCATGVTATDLVLTLTEMLRKHGVVGKFVEFCGDGLSALSLADRATLSNMSPEYGATAALFPVDAETLRYLRATGRGDARAAGRGATARRRGCSARDGDPTPDVHRAARARPRRRRAEPGRPAPPAGPRAARPTCPAELHAPPPVRRAGERTPPTAPRRAARRRRVVIAAITSCTNTSNPSVMVAAGLLARNAVERGLEPKPWVKTSLAPGSRVVTEYLDARGAARSRSTRSASTSSATAARPASATRARSRTRSPQAVARATSWPSSRCCPATATSRAASIRRCARATSPRRRSSWPTRSPGSIDVDLEHEPLGTDCDGEPRLPARHLADPRARCATAIAASVDARDVRARVRARSGRATSAGARWPRRRARSSPGTPTRPTCASRRSSRTCSPSPTPLGRHRRRALLVVLGDSVTTDHISPAGAIPRDSPAGRYLIEHGVEPRDFNSYGSRRGNHEVMMRGTFANIRLRNALADGREGGFTVHLPDGEQLHDLRRRRALPRRGRAAGRARGQGVRLRLVARLGRQGHAAARRARRDRRELRAHPPLEPGRHGRAAAAVPSTARRPSRSA